MTDIRQNINKIESGIMSGLKDFQQATVNHIDKLYRDGQRRVLVSDEVGLGKTLIAKGLVAKMVKLRMEENAPLVKVVYVCSNAAIAEQNINKLRITRDIKVDQTDRFRLSMQHLNIFKQEHGSISTSKYVQLIPLTPATSFRMTSGAGSVNERALMFAILKRIPELKPHLKRLEVVMRDCAITAWEKVRNDIEAQVLECDEATDKKYLKHMFEEISKKMNDGVLQLIEHCNQKTGNVNEIIGKLRTMFAQISVELLKPDFVIMDEFQRFKYLVDSSEQSESEMLACRFFADDVRILLLSATPYKMYSTLEEIDEGQIDEHYSEFFKVVEFLSDGTKGKDKQTPFKEIWNNYSIQLKSFTSGDTTVVEAKNRAEDKLFSIISRTERVSAKECADMIDNSSTKVFLNPSDDDITSYIEMQKLLERIGAGYKMPVDYVKSSPYLLSFMNNYQLKAHISKYFESNKGKVNEAKQHLLWIDDKKIKGYQEIPPANARLQYVQELVFEKQAEKLLWVPPSCPYYELSGAFNGADNFSKTLVFSAWEMVPRMLATMISYEAERKNIKILSKYARQKSKPIYAENKRFTAAKLNFSVSKGEPKGMPLFCLVYPSKSLAQCFNPIDVLQKQTSFLSLKQEIGDKIEKLLSGLSRYEGSDKRKDDRWYYLAPMLMDGSKYVSKWLLQWSSSDKTYDDTENDKETADKRRKKSGFLEHLQALEKIILNKGLKLGTRPDDLADVLVNMALASPAVCAMRAYQSVGEVENIGMPSQLAKIFINRMNSPEATAVIEVCYKKTNKKADKNAHWKNLLAYCKDGNLQAVFDEYAHIMAESNGLGVTEGNVNELHILMSNSLSIHTASYSVDTFESFKKRIGDMKGEFNMRSHFAVAFTKGEGGASNGADRKESVRNSFNSPFRPFVLATTSIGQEGLDFHYYCRRIVHWNLPSNPIDIEQREGRINRYKCLAIRQNVAKRYAHADGINFNKSIWHGLFRVASEKERSENGSDLVPFWGLRASEDMIKIERIVPMYPFSKDISIYERLIKILSLYRLTLGQARQEELLEHLFANHNMDELESLFINLSPYFKNR